MHFQGEMINFSLKNEALRSESVKEYLYNNNKIVMIIVYLKKEKERFII